MSTQVNTLLKLVQDEMIFLNETSAYIVIIFTKNEDCNALLPNTLKNKFSTNNTIQIITFKINKNIYELSYKMIDNETGEIIFDKMILISLNILKTILVKIMTNYPKNDILDIEGNSYINKDEILTMIAMTGPILANLNMSKRLSFRLTYLSH